jgi:hypothetical protein
MPCATRVVVRWSLVHPSDLLHAILANGREHVCLVSPFKYNLYLVEAPR